MTAVTARAAATRYKKAVLGFFRDHHGKAMTDLRSTRRSTASRPPEIVAIQKTLQGPLAGVLAACVPQLAHLPREHVYDAIMDDPRLADACFKIFRSERSRFDHLIRRPDGTPLQDDNETMSCGRTLAEAVTVIVRAVAKRYFVTFDRSRSGPKRSQTQPEPESASVWERTKELLGLTPAAEDPAAPKPSRAEELYRAFREFLLYEWQVPLIPYYAPLRVSVVRTAGPLLLTLRDPEQIEALGQMRLNRPSNAAASQPARKKTPDDDDSHPTFYLPPILSRGK